MIKFCEWCIAFIFVRFVSYLSFIIENKTRTQQSFSSLHNRGASFFLLMFIIFLFIVIPIACCVSPCKVTSPSFYWCIKLLWASWLCIQTFQVEWNLFFFSNYIFFLVIPFLLFFLYFIFVLVLFYHFVFLFCKFLFFFNILVQHSLLVIVGDATCFVVPSNFRLLFATASWVSYNNILSF